MQHFISLLWMNIRYYTIFAFSFDAIFGSIVMLLMMERYNSWYLKLVAIFDSCNICCCCKRFVARYVLGHIEQFNHAQSFSNSTEMDINTTCKTKSGVIRNTNSNTFGSSETITNGDYATPSSNDQGQEQSIDTKTAIPVLDRHGTFDDCEKEYTVNIQLE